MKAKKAKMKKKGETRKYREWERKRRDRLNESFLNLYSTLPNYDPAVNRSKVDIIKHATTCIKELNEKVHKLMEKNDCNNLFVNEITQLKNKIKDLTMRCRQLADLLKKFNVPLPSGIPEECLVTALKEQDQKWTDQIKPEMIKEFLIMIKKNKENKKNDKKGCENEISVMNTRNKNNRKPNTSDGVKISKSLKITSNLVKINMESAISSSPSVTKNKNNKTLNSTSLVCHTTDNITSTVNVLDSMPLRELNCMVLNKSKTIKLVTTSTITASTTSLATTMSKPVPIVLSDNLPKTSLVTVTNFSAPIMATGIQTLPAVINRSPSLLGPGTLILPDGRIVTVPPPPTPVAPTVIAATTQFIVNRPVNPAPAVIVIPNSSVNQVVNSKALTNNVISFNDKVLGRKFGSNTKMIVPKSPSLKNETTKTTFANKVPIPALSSHQHNLIMNLKLQRSVKQLTTKINQVNFAKNSKCTKLTPSNNNQLKTISKEMPVKKNAHDKQKSNQTVRANEQNTAADENIKSTCKSIIENISVQISQPTSDSDSSAVPKKSTSDTVGVSASTTKGVDQINTQKVKKQTSDKNLTPDVNEEKLSVERTNDVLKSNNKRSLQVEDNEETDVTVHKKLKLSACSESGDDRTKTVIPDENKLKIKDGSKSEQDNQIAYIKNSDVTVAPKTPNNSEKYSIDALCCKSRVSDVTQDNTQLRTDKNNFSKEKVVVSDSNEIVSKTDLISESKNSDLKITNIVSEDLNIDNEVNSNKLSSLCVSEHEKGMEEAYKKEPTKRKCDKNDDVINKRISLSNVECDKKKDICVNGIERSKTKNKNDIKDHSFFNDHESNITQHINDPKKTQQSEIFFISPIENMNVDTSRNSDVNLSSVLVTTVPSSVLSSLTCVNTNNNSMNTNLKNMSIDNSDIKRVETKEEKIGKNSKGRKVLSTNNVIISEKNVTSDYTNANKIQQFNGNNCLKTEHQDFLYNDKQLSNTTSNKSLVNNVDSRLQMSDYNLENSRIRQQNNHHQLVTSINKCPSEETSIMKSVQTDSEMQTVNQHIKDKNVILPIINNQHNTCIDDVRLSIPNSEFSNDLFTSLQVPPGSQHPESLSPTAAFLLAFPLVSTSKTSEMLVDNENSDSQHATPTTILQIGNIEPPSNNLYNTEVTETTPSIIMGNNITSANNESFNNIKVKQSHQSDPSVSRQSNSEITQQLNNASVTCSSNTSVTSQPNHPPFIHTSNNATLMNRSKNTSVEHQSNNMITHHSDRVSSTHQSSDAALNHLSNNTTVTHQSNNSATHQSNSVPNADQSSNSSLKHHSNNVSVTHQSSNTTLIHQSINASLVHPSDNTTIQDRSNNGSNMYRPTNSNMSRQVNNNSVAHHLNNSSVTHQSVNVSGMQQTNSASVNHSSSNATETHQSGNASAMHLSSNDNQRTGQTINSSHTGKFNEVDKSKNSLADKHTSNYLVPVSFEQDHHFALDGNFLPVSASNICYSESSDLGRSNMAAYNKSGVNNFVGMADINKLHDKLQDHQSSNCISSGSTNLNTHDDIYLLSCSEKKKSTGLNVSSNSLVSNENNAYDSFILPNVMPNTDSYHDKLFQHRNVQFSSSNPVNSRQKMNLNSFPTINDLESSSAGCVSVTNNKNISTISSVQSDIVPSCTYTQAISSSSISSVTQSYSYNLFSNCNDFPLSMNSHHPCPSNSDSRQQSSVDIKCTKSGNLNIFPPWSSSNVSGSNFTCNATFTTSYPVMTALSQKSCSTQTTMSKISTHSHQIGHNVVENNSSKTDKNSSHPLPKFSSNFNFSSNNHSLAHQDIFNCQNIISGEIFKNDKPIKKSSKISSTVGQPRPPVNWMTTPDLRPALHEVPPSIVPDMMFLTPQKEIDFPTPNMNTCNNVPPFSIANNSTQPFYGLDIPLDIPVQFPEITNTINKSSQRVTTTASTSLNQQVPSHHYSWSPSKSTIPLLSHLDNHSLMIPSTLPTLVGDLALGTNTGPSTPATDSNIRSFNIPPAISLHSSDETNKMVKYNQNKCRHENTSSQHQIHSNHVKNKGNSQLSNNIHNGSNIINNHTKEAKECVSNTNTRNNSLRNNNNSANEFCNTSGANKTTPQQTHQSTNTAGSFLSVSQLVDQVKSESRNVTRRVNKTQQGSNSNYNKQNTTSNNNNSNNIGLQKSNSNSLSSLSQLNDNKGHSQQIGKLSNNHSENFCNNKSSRKLYTGNNYQSSMYSSGVDQSVPESIVQWHHTGGTSSNNNSINKNLSSYKGGNYSAESLIGMNNSHHESIPTFTSSSAMHQFNHQHIRMNHHSNQNYNQVQKSYSSVETPILPVSSIQSSPAINSSNCLTTNVMNPDFHSISNNVVQHHGVDFISNGLGQSGSSQQQTSSYQNCFNFTSSAQSSSATFPPTNHSVSVPFITDNDYQIGCLDTSYLFPHPTPGPPAISHSSANTSATFSSTASSLSNVTSVVATAMSAPTITTASLISLPTNRNCRTTQNQSTSTINKLSNTSTSMTNVNSTGHKTNRKKKDIDNFTSVNPLSLPVTSNLSSTTTASIYGSSYLHPPHVGYSNSLNNNSLPSMRGINNYQPVLSSVVTTTTSSSCLSIHNSINQSSSTLTNFNLSAIFPEINDKQRNAQGHASYFLGRDAGKHLDIGSGNPSFRNHPDYLPPLCTEFNNVMPPQIGSSVNPIPPHFPSEPFISPSTFSTNQQTQ